MKVPAKYNPIDANEFERFDKAVGEVMSVSYEELKRRMAQDKKQKARTKRAKPKSSRRVASRDSEADA